MSKKRIVELDVMRAVAFIFVVLQHTVGGFSYRDSITMDNRIISKFIYTIARAGVPLFLFLTAVTLIYTYGDKLDIKEFYIKKIKYLFLPFAIWSLYRIISTGQTININTIWTIISGDAQYHLWYMAMIIRVYLYFPIIYVFNKFLKKQKGYIQFIVFAALVVGYFELGNYDISGILSSIFFKDPSETQQRFFNCSPLYYYIYFTLGQFFINHYEKFKELIIKNKYVIMVSYVLLLLYEHYVSLEGYVEYPYKFIKSYNELTVFFFCLSIITVYLVSYYIGNYHKHTLSIFRFIGKYSFPAYLIHIAVVNELSCTIYTSNEVTSMLKLFILTAGISLGICYVVSYLPFAKYILGVRTYVNVDKVKENIIKVIEHLRMNIGNINFNK